MWIDLLGSVEKQGAERERLKIERKYEEAKVYQESRRCRYYTSWLRYAIQAYLTPIALNLKRTV